MKSARFGRLVRESRKASRMSWSSRRGNSLISCDCCSMVASMRAKELMRVPISSLRPGSTGSAGFSSLLMCAARHQDRGEDEERRDADRVGQAGERAQQLADRRAEGISEEQQREDRAEGAGEDDLAPDLLAGERHLTIDRSLGHEEAPRGDRSSKRSATGRGI